MVLKRLLGLAAAKKETDKESEEKTTPSTPSKPAQLSTVQSLLANEQVMVDGKIWVKRATRVSITSDHSFELIIERGERSIQFQVMNISTSGIALAKSEKEEENPRVGESIRGRLSSGDQGIDIGARVVRETSSIFAVQFTDFRMHTERFILKFFNPELAAIKMKEVKSNVLKQDTSDEVRFFRGKDGSELYVTTKKGEVTGFSLQFFGNHLDYEPGSGLQFKREGGVSNMAGQVSRSSQCDRAEAVPSDDFLKLAVRFVRGVEVLSDREIEKIVKLIRQKS